MFQRGIEIAQKHCISQIPGLAIKPSSFLLHNNFSRLQHPLDQFIYIQPQTITGMISDSNFHSYYNDYNCYNGTREVLIDWLIEFENGHELINTRASLNSNAGIGNSRYIDLQTFHEMKKLYRKDIMIR